MIIHSSKNPLLIIEASKEDADRLESLGQEESDLRKGARIVNSIINKPRKYRGVPINQTKQDNYNKRYKINDMNAFNNQSDKGRKQLIRDATKKSDFIKTSDTSDRAIKANEKSKKYQDIDPEASTTGMSKEKAEAVKRQLKSGGNLPDSIKSRLVKKAGPVNTDTADRHSNTYFRKTFSDDEKGVFEELKSLANTMKQTNDYGEYKKAYDRFLKLTGYDNASHISVIDFQGDQLAFHLAGDDKTEKAGDSTYYHSSSAKGLKKIYPSFKSSDGVYYQTPRIYFGKDIPMSRVAGNGSSITNDPELSVYKTKFDKDSDVREDSELHGDARYRESRRAINIEEV